MTHFIHTCLKLKSACWPALLFLLLYSNHLQAQNCQNDTIPPVAVCNDFVQISIGTNDDPNDCYLPNGNQFAAVSWVPVAAFDDGSYDDCSNILITVQRLAPYNACIQGLNPVNGHPVCDPAQDPFPDFPSEFERAISENDSLKIYAGEVGITQNIVMRVYQLDAQGNIALHNGQPLVTACYLQIAIEDKVDPVITCPPNVSVTCSAYDPTFAAYGQPTVTDNCCLSTVTQTLNYNQMDTLCLQGTLLRSFTAQDCSGNTAKCTHSIAVSYEQHYFVRFPNDLILTSASPTGNYGEPTFFGQDCEILGLSYSDQVFLNPPDANIRLERTWTIINWCTYNPNLPLITVPNPNPNATPNHPANLPGPTVSAAGTPSPWAPTISKITPFDSAPTDFSTYWNANANGYQYLQIIKILDADLVNVQGTVFSDTLDNCTYDAGEEKLGQWTVKLTGLVTTHVYETVTDDQGHYDAVVFASDTLVEVTLSAPFNFAQNCPSTYLVATDTGQTATQDIPVHLENNCPLLSTDLATPQLRRCFPNAYTVQNCNLGNTLVEDAHVEVTLDSFFVFQNSSLPGTQIGPRTWSFELGDMAPGDCVWFTVHFILSCDAPLGYTHCSEAHIYPDTLCPQYSNWSGAVVDVTGYCDGDTVRLQIQNIGTGDMTEAQEFVVVEDVIMYQVGEFQLDAGTAQSFNMPANGATWRLQAEQAVNHPWGGIESVVVEGCGGWNLPGLVNQFAMSTPNPFDATDCRQNIGSYDPNDKQGFPRGYGDEHFIEANTDLEYLIRFQNTGTDTAFTVVILDTLSQHLDAASVRPGVASHPFDFAVVDGNVLRFRFDNILLPDSNVNEPASHGFVKFRVAQAPDLPDGIRIENSAAIYFDFNDPIITNMTFHTIGQHFILVRTDEGPAALPLRMYPNPARDVALFELPADLGGNYTFTLTDALGRPVRRESFGGSSFRFERRALHAGLYLFQIADARGALLYSGRIVLKD